MTLTFDGMTKRHLGSCVLVICMALTGITSTAAAQQSGVDEKQLLDTVISPEDISALTGVPAASIGHSSWSPLCAEEPFQNCQVGYQPSVADIAWPNHTVVYAPFEDPLTATFHFNRFTSWDSEYGTVLPSDNASRSYVFFNATSDFVVPRVEANYVKGRLLIRARCLAGSGATVVSTVELQSCASMLLNQQMAKLEADFPSILPPRQPEMFSASMANGSVRLAWEDVLAGQGEGASYLVTSTDGSVVCRTTESSCDVSGIEPGATVSFRVRAKNSVGTSDPSQATRAVRVLVKPGSVSKVRTASTDGMVKISWKAPRTTGGSRNVEYVVAAKPGGIVCRTNQTSCIAKELIPGSVYRFRVKAVNAAGSSKGVKSRKTRIPLPFAPLAKPEQSLS